MKRLVYNDAYGCGHWAAYEYITKDGVVGFDVMIVVDHTHMFTYHLNLYDFIETNEVDIEDAEINIGEHILQIAEQSMRDKLAETIQRRHNGK